MSSSKKSKDVGEHSYKLGDVVLAKIRGYPRWPAMVVNPEEVPLVVKKERPISKKTTFYCVRFFPAGDFSWAVPKDLSLLQKHEIEAYINEPHKKSGDLLEGYKIALDPSAWEETLAEQRAAVEAAEADAEVDQLDEGEDSDAEPKKSKASKKRKRESESKPRKKKELKTSTGADSKKAVKKKLGKKNGFRSKDTIESEDEGADDAEGGDAAAESSKRLAPAAKRARKGADEGNFNHLANDPDAIKVKEWRHKLQRAFLSKSVPRPEEMPEYDKLFTIIEKHELTIDQLSFSKLGKVMRHIAQLDQTRLPIPNDDQFMIRKRAEVLLDKWQGFISASGDGSASRVSATNLSATVNGASVAARGRAEKGEAPKGTSGVDVEPGTDAPVNGDDTKTTSGAAKESSAPPAEESVAMDTADD